MKKVLEYLGLIEEATVQVIEMKNVDGEGRRDFPVDKSNFWSDL